MPSRLRLSILLMLMTFIVSSGFGCRWNPFSKDKVLLNPITLEYWGVADSVGQVTPLINAYQAEHPTIKVIYKQLRYDEYKQKLLEAWADDRGPDVFTIPASWLREYKHRLSPMPQTVKVPVLETVGSIKKEVVTNIREFQALAPTDVKRKFAPLVYNNVVLDNKIYGLPYSVDTLATFYNIDILSKSSIPEPIKDFHDLVEQAPKITKATESNVIIQSAVALGGTKNIPRFFDIFSNIMLENGVAAAGASFNPLKDQDSKERLADVFGFYTDFARPGRATYSWNDKLDDAFEMFASGKVAYFFGYSYYANELRDRGVQFSWDITNFPQTRGAEGTKYYGDYWVNVVAKKSKNQDAAWNFIQRTAEADMVAKYLQENKRPTALRNLINDQLKDDSVKIFASQVLTADNWYQGYDKVLAEQYLGEMLEGLLSGDMTMDTSGQFLDLFVNRVNQTYYAPPD